jgi:hypothetical protein
MHLFIHPSITPYLPADVPAFEAMMAWQGQVYRQLEGRCTQRIIIGDQSYFLKQHFGVGWKEIIKNLLQLRLPVVSAKNEWQAIQQLQALNVDVPYMVGYGCRGLNPAKRHSFLLTEELTHTVSLEDFCRDWKTQPPTFALKQKLLKQVAIIARTLHKNGINHRDLYICHFLLDTQVQQNGKLSLIDLHRAQIRKQTPLRWMLKDLAGLYFSSKDIGLTTRDWLRFISEYHEQPWRLAFKWNRHFWQKVEQRGNKLYQQHAK